MGGCGVIGEGCVCVWGVCVCVCAQRVMNWCVYVCTDRGL